MLIDLSFISEMDDLKLLSIYNNNIENVENYKTEFQMRNLKIKKHINISTDIFNIIQL